jgi:type IV pilus assembly protein PilA
MQELLQRLRTMRSEKDERGFTLIELLVVVVIIGILIAIAIPLYLNYENGAKNKSSASDLRAAISTVEQCYTDNNNVYPANFSAVSGATAAPCTGQKVTTSGSSSVYYYTGTTAGVAGYMLVSYQGTAAATSTWYCYNSTVGGSVMTKVSSTPATAYATC